MLRAIAVAKKKNDKIDAGKIADCLRCDFLPECHMAATAIRDRLRVSTPVDPGGLAHFQCSSRISGAEAIEREIDVGEIKRIHACHLPCSMAGARHRNRTERELVGFRIAPAE